MNLLLSWKHVLALELMLGFDLRMGTAHTK